MHNCLCTQASQACFWNARIPLDSSARLRNTNSLDNEFLILFLLRRASLGTTFVYLIIYLCLLALKDRGFAKCSLSSALNPAYGLWRFLPPCPRPPCHGSFTGLRASCSSALSLFFLASLSSPFLCFSAAYRTKKGQAKDTLWAMFK